MPPKSFLGGSGGAVMTPRELRSRKLASLAKKDGLSQATALPVWDRNHLRDAKQKVGGEPPVWMQIFPHPTYVGELEGKKTVWVTDDESQKSVVEYFEAKGTALPIDFEHQTDETDSGILAPAAGRIVELVAGGKKGLLARCEWNELGQKVLREGLYYYDSPSFWFGEKDLRIYILRHLALTNNPASWDRIYVTDHGSIDYGMEKAAASAGKTRSKLILVNASSKGGRASMKITSIVESLRYTIGRPVTVTGNEMRADLQKIIDVIPATDDMILLEDEAQSAEHKDKTIAHLLGDDAIVVAAQRGGDVAPAAVVPPAVPKPVLVALGVAEDTDADGAALAVMNLKASTVPMAKYRELEQQFATATQKSGKERGAFLISSNRAKIRPELDEDILRMADENFALAQRFVDALPPLDLVAQSTGAAPPAPTPAPAAAPAGDLATSSQSKHERTLTIAKEKQVSYAEANALRIKEDNAARG